MREDIVAGIPPRYEVVNDEPKLVSYHVGLDLGKLADFTALAIVEKWPEEPERRKARASSQNRREEQPLMLLRHLERYPLGTDYRVIAEHVRELMTDPALTVKRQRTNKWHDKVWVETNHPELVVDSTGVGVAVAELINGPEIKHFTPVTLTGGDKVSGASGVWRVPKKALISAFEASFYRGDVKIAEELELTKALVDELMNFKRDVNIATGNVAFEPWREAQHDDLLFAACLACWGAMRPRSNFMSGVFRDEF